MQIIVLYWVKENNVTRPLPPKMENILYNKRAEHRTMVVKFTPAVGFLRMGVIWGKTVGKNTNISICILVRKIRWRQKEREADTTEVLTMYRASWHDTVGIWKASCFFCSGPRGQLWTVRFVPAKFLCVIRSSPGSFCQRHSLLPCLAVSGQWTGDTTFFHMCFGPF